MTHVVLQALYFMLPAYAANMAPVLFEWIPWGSSSLDRGLMWRGKRIFGDHKTYRGFACGIALATAIVFVQKWLFEIPFLKNISLLSYPLLSFSTLLLLGLAFGAGSLIGDLIKSFFKRRLNILPGRPWIPFDQLDFVIGALLAVSIFYTPPLPVIIIILIITPLLHLFSNVIAYWVGLKKVWW